MLASYAFVLAWQLIWHGLIPPPWGSRNIGLAVFACLPLLIPLPGLVRSRYRSMIWAGMLLMLYMAIGIMEIWSNPPQRVPASVQVALAVFYVFAFKKRNQG
jgi:uncharacterized membrane protein